jgi:hypothetical protein
MLEVTYMRTNELIVNVHVPDAVLSAKEGSIAALPRSLSSKSAKCAGKNEGWKTMYLPSNSSVNISAS